MAYVNPFWPGPLLPGILVTATPASAPVITALGVQNTDVTLTAGQAANGGYITLTTGSGNINLSLPTPASATSSFNLTVVITQGGTARTVTLKTSDANITSTGGVLSSGKALPNSGAGFTDVYKFTSYGTLWETVDARYARA